MLNKIPPNSTIDSILIYLGKSKKYGPRDRALYSLRSLMRIKDISILLVSDVLNSDNTIRSSYESVDGILYELDAKIQSEMRIYIDDRFDKTLPPNLDIPLFTTQKSAKFSNNTLAQHFSYLDKDIWQNFSNSQVNTKKCKACGEQNKATSKFCSECGTAL